MKRLALLSLLLLPGASLVLCGQDVVVDHPWRFHAGDDIRWAQPGFDDSGWENKAFPQAGSWVSPAGSGGFAWFRLTVAVPAGDRPLAIALPAERTSYQVFVNGQPVGSYGNMPPHARSLTSQPRLFPIPPQSTGTLTLAVRLWTFAGTDDYVGYTPPEKPVAFGERNQVEELFHLNDLRDRVGLTSNYLLLLLSVLAAIAGMVIYFQRPGEREYLWFGLFLLFEGLGNLAGLLQAFYALPYIASGILDLSVALLDIQMQLLMFWQLLHGRRNWAFWCASSCVAAGCLVGVLDLSGAFGGFNLANALEFPIWGFYNLYILVLAVRGVRRGLPDARFLLFPVCLFELTWFAMDYVAFGSVAGLDTSTVNTLLNQTFQSPFPFNLNDISSVLFLAAMLGIMIRRFTRTAQREEQQTRELEAARAVQQVLIPQSLPQVAGYRVESVYRPFGEVGGDFFQILPMNQGGMLAVIGDVSGKGVPAAMMVSLLVGAFHTLAETTASPAAILDGLNRRALGRSRGGFTTCLVIRADADGRCTVANAGHLSPYRKGEEVSVEAGLPLGLSAEAEYGESLVDLAAGEQLTLLSDGVLEARSAAGELYGFDRTRLLSQEDAERIADAAQVFGQEDDITVLTMTYAAGAA